MLISDNKKLSRNLNIKKTLHPPPPDPLPFSSSRVFLQPPLVLVSSESAQIPLLSEYDYWTQSVPSLVFLLC